MFHGQMAAILALRMGLGFAGSPGGEFGGPIAGVTADEVQRFNDGRTAFEAVEDAADGLGPVFNGTSCAGCHNVGGTGGGSEVVETRFGAVTGAAFDPLVERGGSLVQSDGIGAQGACVFVGETVPAEATVVAQRRATPLFGLGLVDAVPDATFVALAGQQAGRRPEAAGRPSMVLDVTTGAIAVGKFGWKGQVASLLRFSADAYVNEMGITTPLAPDENCPQGDCALLACDPVPGIDDDLEDVELFRDFMRLLAPPPLAAGAGGGRVMRRRSASGNRVFERLGCPRGHVSARRTGARHFAALRFRTFEPYSDFLLHDMGSLGDGIAQGDASGDEMRTSPLWGLRIITTFLHDGRARTI